MMYLVCALLAVVLIMGIYVLLEFTDIKEALNYMDTYPKYTGDEVVKQTAAINAICKRIIVVMFSTLIFTSLVTFYLLHWRA